MEIFIVTAANDHEGETLVGAYSTVELAGAEAHRLAHQKEGYAADAYAVWRAKVDPAQSVDETTFVTAFDSGKGCLRCRSMVAS